MVGPPSVTGARVSIASQAARRLVFSLGLFVFVVGFSAAIFYNAAIDKAAEERANDLVEFYRTRLVQIEREWEVQARDFRVRIEYTRLLEDPRTAVLNLQAFMTVQGHDRRFQHLCVRTRDGELLFHFGKGMNSEELHSQLKDGVRYFLAGQQRLYRVFEEPIWLGERGMGRMLVFFPIDNALLGQLASPGVSLMAMYHGSPVASSLGARGLVAPEDGPTAQSRTLPWSGNAHDPLQVTIRAPVKVLFTTTELAIAVGVIPILDGLILWFALGTWLMRQTRRINALGRAVRYASGESDGREGMERKLREASASQNDEIHAVADTFRCATRLRDMAQQQNTRLNERLERHNKELEAVNGELESFIYSVSHDLRAPLRSIAGFSSILQEDYGARLDATGNDYLNRIVACAARMSDRMDDLLYLSRISRHEMVCSNVDLSAIANRCVSELRENNPERDVSVEIADGLTAFADPRLIVVAISNLLANAWKFTLRASAPRIEVHAFHRDGETIYFVRDNGAGFEPALASAMFLPFHRLHSDDEFEGTGLGLAIVERVVRRHGGKLWAEGAVEKGATVFFTLQAPSSPEIQVSDAESNASSVEREVS